MTCPRRPKLTELVRMFVVLVVICVLLLLGVAAEEVDVGCVNSSLVRRCFTLYRDDWSWQDAASLCRETYDSKLAVVDTPGISQMLSTALTPLEYPESMYKAWIAGQKLHQQLELNWINGQAFQG